MKKLFCIMMTLLLLANGWICAYATHTREEVRAAYRTISDWSDSTPYVENPVISAPYAAGKLNPDAISDALNYLNFIRWLAGLEVPVKQSRIYNYQCQHGAVLLAALDYVDHNAPRPEDMDENFYNSAHLATISGNIAKFNWMRNAILREGVEYFVRDDGDNNLAVLGHRRWALNPYMASTGFGLANSATGMSYVTMYAHDAGNPEAEWTEVCWPSAGAFPATLMHADLAWSIILNPEIYDLDASLPTVVLAESESGLRFEFQPATGTGDGFCTFNFEDYGAGPCLIFRPDFSNTDFTDYQQNQRWTVSVEGLCRLDGSSATLEYTVDMISLFVEDVAAIELSQLEATLRPGESMTLSAQVLPTYADDLRVEWISSNPNVASVDTAGAVTALGTGICEITARSANGRSDTCILTVSDTE